VSKFSEKERALVPMFEEALGLRDSGALRPATALLESLRAQLTSNERRLLTHVHLQLGNLYGKLDETALQITHFLEASSLSPRHELASLSLFHALFANGQRAEALNEMLRLLRRRDSELYRELLCDGYGDEMDRDSRAMIVSARALLARYRNAN
jgi:hypothetical protein